MARHAPSSTARHALFSTARHTSTPINLLTKEQPHKMPWHPNSPPRQKETTPRWGKADKGKFKEYIRKGKINISSTTPVTIETICLAYFKERSRPTFRTHYRALAASLVGKAERSGGRGLHEPCLHSFLSSFGLVTLTLSIY
jgi:hypothetical protein